MYDSIVVGGGIGGVLSGALLSKEGKKVALFEKEKNLGGSASTFKRDGRLYNAGATTLASYEAGGVVYELFERAGFVPKTKELLFSHIVTIEGKQIVLYRDIDRYIEEVNSLFYHPKNELFFKEIKKICEQFYATSGYRYDTKDFSSALHSAISFAPALLKFFPYLAQSARGYIDRFFGGVSKGYLEFLDAQTRIAAQATTKEINFFTAALAIGYPFFKNHYAYGGMGSVTQELSKKIGSVYTGETVEVVDRVSGGFVVRTKNRELFGRSVILNTPVFSSSKLFGDPDIKRYFDSKKSLDSKQSAFVVYMRVRQRKEFAHHYQIIADENPKNCVSNALFVSFSDKDDALMSKDGEFSVTASIHTMSDFWRLDDRNVYKRQKDELKNQIISLICDNIGLEACDIIDSFAATPMTFERYIGRSSLGGVVLTQKNLLRLASNETPFRGLYCVGDTAFAAQGWPGVALGVRNLLCTIRN